jgi:hypothetical protein
MKHLQVALLATLAGLATPINVTPVDVAIPDSVATGLQEAIALGDLADVKPGDGQLEETEHLKVPVKLNLFIVHLNTTVEVDAEVIVRIVDKPDAAPAAA